MNIHIPNPGRGRRSAEKEAEHQAELEEFYGALIAIDKTVPISVSSRGWCYLLEEHGLEKGDFSRVEALINDGRKNGNLPTDICSADEKRSLRGLERLDYQDPEDYSHYVANELIGEAIEDYQRISQWENQDYFVSMAVEKKDLVQIFGPVCREYGVPLANFSGWADINSRLEFMRLFKEWEAKGKQCVLLYCGDHDPGGLHISSSMRKNLDDLSGTWSKYLGSMDWHPDDLIIDRFGLNYDFITQHHLSWVENLITGSGKNLADPGHKEHHKPYVQDYLRRFGARKVEANALVTRIDAGRELCKQAILKYIDIDSLEAHREQLVEDRDQVRELVEEGL